MRRNSARTDEAIVRTFHPENLLKVSYHGYCDSIPHLCIEVREDYERCLTIAKLWDDTFHMVRVMRTNTGHDIVEEACPVTSGIKPSSLYLSGYALENYDSMIEIMDGINHPESHPEISLFFDEVKMYLKHEEE